MAVSHTAIGLGCQKSQWFRVRVEEEWLLYAGIWTQPRNEVQNPVTVEDSGGAQVKGRSPRSESDAKEEKRRAILAELY